MHLSLLIYSNNLFSACFG